ncbi:unnamed protein product [Cladocopium goreaui]|uniref:Pentatricopeptide repeat-containing protein GUN1, chloroplastic (Pentatricopeptide repeat-containing protein At2g31400) (Protein GENOMES UNCOUPLED 1) n=1 Tax=Cladocopium goreaui TaxID=2562237 RepID=A0A9P1FFK6_9DINO|nr:unnamed protein product [Cladocopium goreaui]
MRCEGLVPDVITYNTVMDVCQKSGHWKLALQIFRQLLLSGSHTADVIDVIDVITMNTAMGAYLKGGNWQQALLLLSQMPQKQLMPSTISCNIGIKACETGGRWDLAIHLLSAVAVAVAKGELSWCFCKSTAISG